MGLNVHHKNNKIKIWFLVIFLTILSVVIIILYLKKSINTNLIKSPSYQPTTNQPKVDANQTKNKGETTPVTGVDLNKNTTEIPVSKGAELSINKLEQSNGIITYTAKISGSISNNGICSATYTNDISKPVTRSSTPNNLTCGPVDIPEGEFSAIGNWVLTVRYFADNVQLITTQNIEVK